MSFPIRSLHLPSPLHHRCFPSPPPSEPSDDSDLRPSPLIASSPQDIPALRSPGERRKSMDFAYFPLVTNVPSHNDTFAIRSVNTPPALVTPARLALAWAILRLRYPILASVGLVDPFGKVSYSYDPPCTVDAALLEGETSLEFRRNIADLSAYYKAGCRRVSRSHLSHLIVSTATSSSTIISPPPTPPLQEPGSRVSDPLIGEISFLLCTPHYVADTKALDSYLEELGDLLTRHCTLNDSELKTKLESELGLAAVRQPPVAGSIPIPPPLLKMRSPREGRFHRGHAL